MSTQPSVSPAQEIPLPQETTCLPTVAAYADHFEHLSDELKWLDWVIQLEVVKLRSRTQPFQQLAVSQQVYVSHEEVDWLLSQTFPEETADPPFSDQSFKLIEQFTAIHQQIVQLRQQIQARVFASLAEGVFLPLVQLANTFALDSFEQQSIVICLAPELQQKYDRLYAYLQDDITRKKPSIELILTLLCAAGSDRLQGNPLLRWRSRVYFFQAASLLHTGILRTLIDPQSPSGNSNLRCFLQLDERILNYLLGYQLPDPRLATLVTHLIPQQDLAQVLVASCAKTQLSNLLQRYFAPQNQESHRLVVHLHGPTGVGKRELALAACKQLNCALLYCDLELLLARENEAEDLLRLIFREGLLLQTALYFDHLDAITGSELKTKMLLKLLALIAVDYGRLVFLAGSKPWHPQNLFESMVFQAIALPLPDMALRTALWSQTLGQHLLTVDSTWAIQLANQFRLTPQQIRSAMTAVVTRVSTTKTVTDIAALAADANEQLADAPANLNLANLYAACRSQTNYNLSELAVKIEPRYDWQNLILPTDRLAQLQEICSQSRHRYRVFGEWGFDRKLSHGKGLSALFSGSPGTGKTMAAEVLAHDLQVDLYKIDLSSVVSKYIGETEKNLSHIFQEAETSNAILFFDEADALFGKRTEVSDAHDRYANIETSYLLQKMEEYEGIVILATNLRENMDDAFTRRLRFIVEFPFPDESNRRLIWQNHFPPDAPLQDDIDYDFLAHKLPISGGNIKNIVLNAAFFAAEDGGAIAMEHILRAAKREFEKIGKLWSELQPRSRNK